MIVYSRRDMTLLWIYHLMTASGVILSSLMVSGEYE